MESKRNDNSWRVNERNQEMDTICLEMPSRGRDRIVNDGEEIIRIGTKIHVKVNPRESKIL